jgi:hypothetical protein
MRWHYREILSFHGGAIHEKTVVFSGLGDFFTASDKEACHGGVTRRGDKKHKNKKNNYYCHFAVTRSGALEKASRSEAAPGGAASLQ